LTGAGTLQTRFQPGLVLRAFPSQRPGSWRILRQRCNPSQPGANAPGSWFPNKFQG
jgi:hypothetical protein